MSYLIIITEKCEKKRFFAKNSTNAVRHRYHFLPALRREMPQNRWKYPDGSVTIKLYEPFPAGESLFAEIGG